MVDPDFQSDAASDAASDPASDPASDAASEAASDAIRHRLTAERAHTAERLAALELEFTALVEAGTGTNIDDEHDPEGATIAFERQQVAALREQARARLDDLDRAIGELQRGEYGICERCGRPIAAGRLQARPDARTCIACASA